MVECRRLGRQGGRHHQGGPDRSPGVAMSSTTVFPGAAGFCTACSKQWHTVAGPAQPSRGTRATHWGDVGDAEATGYTAFRRTTPSPRLPGPLHVIGQSSPTIDSMPRCAHDVGSGKRVEEQVRRHQVYGTASATHRRTNHRSSGFWVGVIWCSYVSLFRLAGSGSIP